MDALIITTPEALKQIVSDSMSFHIEEFRNQLLESSEFKSKKIPRFFSRKQVASHLGICLSMVDKLASSGKLTRRKVGSKTVFSSNEVEALTGERKTDKD